MTDAKRRAEENAAHVEGFAAGSAAAYEQIDKRVRGAYLDGYGDGHADSGDLIDAADLVGARVVALRPGDARDALYTLERALDTLRKRGA